MNFKALKVVEKEIKRFKRCAQALTIGDGIGPTCPKESGALRRASMDLTRALADLRRPG